MSEPEAILELQNICRDFGKNRVVDDLTLRLPRGAVVCLLGPSGCGKSTTLRIAAGVDRQTHGQVLFDGQCVSDADVHLPPEARGIGLMFQDFALFPHLTVAQNIGFGIRKAGARAARVADLIKRVDLQGYDGKYPHQLSGGEQQRVALARALAPRPRVLLMDEPFSGLDDRLRDDVRDATLDLVRAEGTAVLLVTHEPAEAMFMADKIALMRDGRIVQTGAPYNIYNAPVDAEAAGFFSDTNIIRGTVTNALTQTPFGEFLCPGYGDGSEVEIVIRPQHLKIDFDRGGRGPNPTPQDGVAARGIVQRARFMGDVSRVEFAMDFGQVALRATVPGVFLPKEGTVMWLTVRRDRCFLFPATG